MGFLSLRTVAQVALLSLVAFVLNPLPEMVLVDRFVFGPALQAPGRHTDSPNIFWRFSE